MLERFMYAGNEISEYRHDAQISRQLYADRQSDCRRRWASSDIEQSLSTSH